MFIYKILIAILCYTGPWVKREKLRHRKISDFPQSTQLSCGGNRIKTQEDRYVLTNCSRLPSGLSLLLVFREGRDLGGSGLGLGLKVGILRTRRRDIPGRGTTCPRVQRWKQAQDGA